MTVNPNEMTVVFDGGRNPSYAKRGSGKPWHKGALLGAGRDRGRLYMENDRKRKGKAKTYLIVSSDRKITDFAKAHFMNISTSDEFIEYLE